MAQFRRYQEAAINTGVTFFDRKSGKNDILVLPTGSGKSWVIGGICSNTDGNTLVLQPSKEILEQNYMKAQKLMGGAFRFGEYDLGIYSASVGIKQISKVTFATIGSIVNKPDLFKHFRRIIQDECDVTNAKGGMYAEFFDTLSIPVLGATATPYRLHPPTTFNNSVIKMIHRTRPRVFHNLAHITQNKELFDAGYLCPVNYHREEFDQAQLSLNSTGAEFTDLSVKRYGQDSRLTDKITRIVKESAAPSILIFVNSIEEAQNVEKRLCSIGQEAAILTGETPKDLREKTLADFTAGRRRIVINVGVLTVGFDFPALTCIIMARITNSLRLYYQILGRGIRISPETGKEYCDLFDLGGNVRRFGHIEDFEIVGPPGMERLKSGDRFLTGVDLKTGRDLEAERAAHAARPQASPGERSLMFGQYKGIRLAEIPGGYLDWIVGKFSDGPVKQMALDEMARRRADQGRINVQ